MFHQECLVAFLWYTRWANVWKSWTTRGEVKLVCFVVDNRTEAKDCGEKAEKAEEETKATATAKYGDPFPFD